MVRTLDKIKAQFKALLPHIDYSQILDYVRTYGDARCTDTWRRALKSHNDFWSPKVIISRVEKFPKASFRGITPRRVSAAKRFNQRQLDALPLLTDWVSQSLDSPEDRILKADSHFSNYWQRLRNSRASDWRHCRSLLRNHPQARLILKKWNSSSLPAEPCYLLDMIRSF